MLQMKTEFSQKVQGETKQQQRDERGVHALFLAALFLNSLSGN